MDSTAYAAHTTIATSANHQRGTTVPSSGCVHWRTVVPQHLALFEAEQVGHVFVLALHEDPQLQSNMSRAWCGIGRVWVVGSAQ